ncbi:hypothetical protein [Streptomyces tendae]|uniref:hypothetical protein n=1 Tax=Streptomyces tendae TaxID=1932 RepID=UPI001F0F4548|nr:hypothetical protein [Streptomyces tendae]
MCALGSSAERILRAAHEGGFGGDSEVRTRVGRTWIQTDTLVEGADGRRIGWEVQLSTIDERGLRGVRARAGKAAKNGITPAWHTDRAAYAQRNDTHWTRSDRLPAHVIARNGDLRIVSGFRVLDFWHCDTSALYPCPNGIRRCGTTELITLQQAADAAHHKLQQLDDHHERDLQRQVWRQAAEVVQAAVTRYARTKCLNRYEVEARLRQLVRHSPQ